MTRKVAIIGHGAIGRELATALLAREGFTVAIVLRPGSARATEVSPDCVTIRDPVGLAAFRPAIVVEAAGAAAVREWGPVALAMGTPLLLSSVGALHDDMLRAALIQAAEAAGTRLYLPSGALAGLDYVRAARGAQDLRIRYESRKPPAAWRDELYRLGHTDEPKKIVTLLEGNAREAAARYPANLNVAATLALAGIGFEATQVRVVVDPNSPGNTHGITVESELGSLELSVANRPSPDNPKTSWIVSRSLLAAIEQHFSTIVVL
jgi:aspartate dehydrogenase